MQTDFEPLSFKSGLASDLTRPFGTIALAIQTHLMLTGPFAARIVGIIDVEGGREFPIPGLIHQKGDYCSTVPLCSAATGCRSEKLRRFHGAWLVSLLDHSQHRSPLEISWLEPGVEVKRSDDFSGIEAPAVDDEMPETEYG